MKKINSDKKHFSWKNLFWIIPAGLILIIITGFTIWAYTPPQPMPEAIASLNSDNLVNIVTGDWLIFKPVNQDPTTGLIFYPGGRVDYRSYAPAAKEIASQGYLVVIVRMPFNLAVFGANRAQQVIDYYPKVTHWVLAGHSLGGAMAANFVYTHPGNIESLILWAAYPAASNDLSTSKVMVLSISASLDGLATPEKIQASTTLLPPDTQWMQIQGGDHAQFGWYGPQSGDNNASISREDQQKRIVEATVAFLRESTR